MNEPHYAKGITAANLRAFLKLWQETFDFIDETKQSIIEVIEEFFDE